MDNKNTALNQNIDLISTKGLDEMQREQAFKIAFNCFKYFIGEMLLLPPCWLSAQYFLTRI